jgi:hypothetical protein
MASKPIQPLVLDSIGIYGLNRQSSAASLPPQFLTTANNIMLDEKGRVTTREGIKQITNNVHTGSLDTDGNPTTNTLIVKSLGEYISATGATTLFTGAGANIYKINVANTPYTLDAQTFGGSATTKTDGNWQFTNFNNQFYGVQAGNQPINYDGTTWKDLEDVGSYHKPTGVTTFTPSCILGDYGRIWVGNIGENKDVVYYSDTLIGQTFNGGASGSVDLKTVWSGDEITALASFMGKLVIFGKNNIVIYNDPWDPAAASFQLDEVIEGVGCVARDSVQVIGDDIVFLSSSGVRSLARTMVQDKMPLTDLSLAVKDEIRTHIVTADLNKVKGQYDLSTGTYLLGFGGKNILYVFDFKSTTPEGAPRITTWNFDSKKNPGALLSTDDFLYIGLGATTNFGKVATYSGFYDVEKKDVTATYGTSSACTTAGHTWESTTSKCYQDVDNTYQADFKTTWLDFEQPGITKFLKRFLAIWSGGKNMNVTLNWFRDYNVTPTSANFTLDPTTGGVNALWGQAKYGNSKYAPAFQPTEYKVSMSKAAKVVRLQIIQTVSGFKASLQNISIWAKQGKIR